MMKTDQTPRSGRRRGDATPEPASGRRGPDDVEVVPGPSPARRAGDRRRTDGGVVVDPRLRARRVEVMRSEGRRRLRTLVGLVAVTALGLGLLALIDSSWLDVDEVRVEGAERSSVPDLVEASGITLGEPLLEVDVERALDGVGASPWVLSAGLDRRLDGTVVITVVERLPALALPAADGSTVLIDETGRQLGTATTVDAGWLPVAGLVASGELGRPAPSGARSALELQDLLPPALRSEVVGLDVEDDEFYLELVAGGRARLGRPDALGEKLVALTTMLERVDLRCLREIDVRVPSAPALSRIGVDGQPGASLTDLGTCT